MSTVQPGHASPTRGRDRRHLFPGRPRGVHARFTDDEYAELAAAANRAGLTTTGFCAQASLDAARNPHANAGTSLDHEALSNLQVELFHVRAELNQLRAGRVRHLDNEGRSVADQDEIVATATRSLPRLDTLISHIHTMLANQPRPRSYSNE